MRQIITNNEGFSTAFVKPIADYTQEDLGQLAKYYYMLRKYYTDDRSGINQYSHGWKLGVYKELKDIEYFFVLLGHDITSKPYPVDFSSNLTKFKTSETN